MSRFHKRSLTTRSVVLFAAILLFLSAALSGCGRSADELYSEGKKLIVSDDSVDEGISLLLEFAEKHPDDDRTPEVLLAVATARQSRGDIDGAVETFTRLIDRYPDTDEAYKGLFLLSYLYFEDGDRMEEAKQSLMRFVELYPDSELTVSARVLLDNIGRPVDEWDIVRELSVGTGE